MDGTTPSSGRQKFASNALASVASFSKKHLVPPTPGSSSLSSTRAPQHERMANGGYISRDPRPTGTANPGHDSTPIRFANFKRLVKHNPVPCRHLQTRTARTTYLSTPEEDRGHFAPSRHDVNPPTIQQIASGVATRPIGSKTSRISTSNQPSSSTASISSTNSSAGPLPLKSSMKKTSKGTPSLSTSIASSSSHSTSRPSPLSIASKPFGGMRNLFHSKHFPAKTQELNELFVIDDGGSLISEQSSGTKRVVGRVRFSDDEDETGHETITMRGRRRQGLQDGRQDSVSPTNGHGNANGVDIDLPSAKLSGSSLGRSEVSTSPSSPGVLSGARKNMMKMFHRTTSIPTP
ncbi:uncharacterized protein EI90DRAFT_3062939 [Cantharellus anzutake]|uniref:uncharacterized protein n=1 Tax=Cantharellus anzutake TaxID=1750568 RepID=UPI001908825D|nr:uncharacterized protein EI90DRAFT_3062939 [Cantharellus anzutake]KAF8329536.1 hypothetical protein EI90DRAFT_3062939 [Cantharellus anzutake]